MKVLDLRCGQGHRFEGWFGSALDFETQTERALVECPVCSDKHIVRLPSAPRLNVSRPAEPPPPDTAPAAPDPQREGQARWLEAVRHALSNTEDVGERFPEEARRIHHGEVEARGIRGRASKKDADALREEGIEIVSIALPEALKGPLH